MAKKLGIEVRRGDPADNLPGERIVIPVHPGQLMVKEVELQRLHRSYLRHALATLSEGEQLAEIDLKFLAAETGTEQSYVEEIIDEILGKSR
jgi:hypothetical protein